MAIRRLALADRPDVAVGFMHSVYLPLGVALLGTGIPVLGSEHIVYEHFRGRPLEAVWLRAGVSLFAAITAISRPVIETYPERVRKKMVVIPNPVVVGVGARANVK